jgi:hypothetical protein
MQKNRTDAAVRKNEAFVVVYGLGLVKLLSRVLVLNPIFCDLPPIIGVKMAFFQKNNV